jgi:hypothetical protein
MQKGTCGETQCPNAARGKPTCNNVHASNWRVAPKKTCDYKHNREIWTCVKCCGEWLGYLCANYRPWRWHWCWRKFEYYMQKCMSTCEDQCFPALVLGFCFFMFWNSSRLMSNYISLLCKGIDGMLYRCTMHDGLMPRCIACRVNRPM